jgi:hypothetical protein
VKVVLVDGGIEQRRDDASAGAWRAHGSDNILAFSLDENEREIG